MRECRCRERPLALVLGAPFELALQRQKEVGPCSRRPRDAGRTIAIATRVERDLLGSEEDTDHDHVR